MFLSFFQFIRIYVIFFGFLELFNCLQFLWSNILPPLNITPAISLPQFHSLNFPPVNSFLQFLSHISISEVFLKILSPNVLAPLFHLLEFFTHNFSSPFWSMLKLLLLSTLGCGTLRISHILLKVRSFVASLQFLAKGTCGKSPIQELC